MIYKKKVYKSNDDESVIVSQGRIAGRIVPDRVSASFQ
jgi:hypothetical protein